MTSSPAWNLWNQAFWQRATWRRACWMACSVGALQVMINQGDYWWRLDIDGVVVAKTIMTPVVTFGVALVSGVWADVEKRRATLGSPVAN